MVILLGSFANAAAQDSDSQDITLSDDVIFVVDDPPMSFSLAEELQFARAQMYAFSNGAVVDKSSIIDNYLVSLAESMEGLPENEETLPLFRLHNEIKDLYESSRGPASEAALDALANKIERRIQTQMLQAEIAPIEPIHYESNGRFEADC